MTKMFGTNGIRGIANEYMNSTLALKIGMAIGKKYGGRVVIGTDTRVSAEMIKTAVSSGLMSMGADVIDIGILPTPAVQYYVKTHNDISCGIVITASHNPPEYNGIKLISGDGTEASKSEEEDIERLYETELETLPWNEVGTRYVVLTAGDEYIDAIISKVDAKAIRDAKLTVCLDCANGASFETSSKLLKKLKVRAVTLNSDPQGEFPGHQSEPTKDNLTDLMRMTREIGANMGVAHDGDADRCVFITSKGDYVSGEESLALMSKYLLKKRKGTIVTTVATSSMVKDVVIENGGDIDYTMVGSPVVARRMIQCDAVFGGEGNGGLIFPEMQYCRDGAMGLAMMLECIVKNGDLNKQIDELPKYHKVERKIKCPSNFKNAVLEEFTKSPKEGTLCTIDGVKLTFDNGWVLVRPSGTEPLFRVQSESKDPAIATERVEKYAASISSIVNNM